MSATIVGSSNAIEPGLAPASFDGPYFREEHVLFREQLARFIAEEVKPKADAWEKEGMVPRAVLRRMGELGFLGLRYSEEWGGSAEPFFPGRPYLNRGIAGQTTPQMLVRFRQDVINLQPKVVIILAGTNDIAGNTGPMRIEDIEADYASLADLALWER